MSKNNKEKFGTQIPKELEELRHKRRVKTEQTKFSNRKAKGVKTDITLPKIKVKKSKSKVSTKKTKEELKEIRRNAGRKAWETRLSRMSKEEQDRLAQKKIPLTEQEKAKRRSEGGRKAWQTRRSKMSDEQYEQWKKQFVERMQKGKQRKKELGMEVPTSDNIVYFDVFDKVEELLNTLPNAIPIYDKRSGFRYMEWEDSYPLWDTYQNAREDMGDEEYSAWLIQNEEALVTALTNFQHSSDQNSATQHLQTAMNILRGTNALSLSELTALNDYMEKVV